MENEVKEVTGEEGQGVIPVSKAKELMERVANGVATKIMAAFGIEEKKEAEPTLAPEAEKMVQDFQLEGLTPNIDEFKASIRKEIVKLESKNQVMWLRAFDLGLSRDKSGDRAKKFAWSFIRAEEQETQGAPKEAAPETSQPTEVESKKEEVMASVNVTADAKQNPKAGDVSGFQSGESASSGAKGASPVVPGKVITEAPAVDVLPKAVKTGYELKTDYESMAAKADKEIEALKRNKGLITEKSKLASTMLEVRKIAASDLALVESFVAYAKKKKGKKVSPKAQEYISKKIGKLKEEEGKTPEQAAGQAYGMAREKGFDVPKPKEA